MQTFTRFHLRKKKQIEINSYHRGYIPINTSTLRTSYVAKVTKPNQSESIIIQHELEDNDPDVINKLPLAGPNRYPENIKYFKDTVTRYKEAMYKLIRRTIQAFSIGLDLPQDYFDKYFEKPTTFLRLFCYPPQPENVTEDLFGSAPHTDYGFCTFVLQDDIGGLQVLNQNGIWLDVPPIKGTFIMNSGDTLHRWSNSKLLATPHRVINKSNSKKRYSAVLFFDPHFETVIHPLPSCISPEEQPKFEVFKYGDYLMEKLNINHDQRRKNLISE